MLASMMALPREGHLEQAFHMFAYLKNKHNAEMVLDPSVPNVDDSQFPKHDWSHTPYVETYACSSCRVFTDSVYARENSVKIIINP